MITALRHVADAGVTLYWIAGNRDFLVGERFAAAANLTLLAEPHVSKIGGTTIALVHGDAQCTGDSGYMAFRTQVRQRAWQDQFLALPLAQRKAIIAGLREGSRHAQNDKSNDIMDVAQDAIEALLTESGSAILIHGHTHRPAVHTHGAATRYVLPDWDCDGATERGGWIAIDATGTVTRHDVRGATLS